MSLGPLPSLKSSKFSHNNINSNNPVSNSISCIISPTRVGYSIGSSVICLGFEYRLNQELRYKKFLLPLKFNNKYYLYNNEIINENNKLDIAKSIAKELILLNPLYLNKNIINITQIQNILIKLITTIASNNNKSTESAGTELDLNRVSDNVLNSVKASMAQDFNLKQLKPGDNNYVYDRRIEFEEGTEPSDWD